MRATDNPDVVRQAAATGLVGLAAPGPPAALQSAIELALRRFGDLERLTAEVRQLRGALHRRVIVERAKGILMERHDIEEHEAYRLLRDHARRHRQALEDTAELIITARRLLPSRRSPDPGDSCT